MGTHMENLSGVLANRITHRRYDFYSAGQIIFKLIFIRVNTNFQLLFNRCGDLLAVS
jgi:hypothetical protein